MVMTLKRMMKVKTAGGEDVDDDDTADDDVTSGEVHSAG